MTNPRHDFLPAVALRCSASNEGSGNPAIWQASHALRSILPAAATFSVVERGPGRDNAFLAGQFAGRAALSRLHVTATAIGRDQNGRPTWPEGIVGSIAHCTGLTVALCARVGDFLGIGVDVERRGQVAAALAAAILDAVPSDATAITPDDVLRTLVAKEACLKADTARQRSTTMNAYRIAWSQDGHFTSPSQEPPMIGRVGFGERLLIGVAYRPAKAGKR